MFWFVCEDIEYYQRIDFLSNAIFDKLVGFSVLKEDRREEFLGFMKSEIEKTASEILYTFDFSLLILPEESKLLDYMRNQFSKSLIVVSNQNPPANLRDLFVLFSLPNKFGLLSSQAKLQDIKESEALEAKLGLSVIDSPFTLKDIGGATALKRYTAQLLKAEEQGYKAKGVFLVGIPGTGKTFFPKCFSGELKRLLIALNLSQIMESDSPIDKLNMIFEYLHDRAKDFPDEKFVILIDEIEKMIGNATAKEKQMLGRLLTVLNDINTPACEYRFNAIFFATANDLGSILANNPEFLRRGRWDELFFINLPTHEYAVEMFEIYIKKYKLGFAIEIMSLEEIFAEIENKYQKDNTIANRFPYTPAEIENFCKRLDFVKKAEGDNFSKDDILECVEMIIPLTKSAQEGLNKMVAQKELFIEI